MTITRLAEAALFWGSAQDTPAFYARVLGKPFGRIIKATKFLKGNRRCPARFSNEFDCLPAVAGINLGLDRYLPPPLLGQHRSRHSGGLRIQWGFP